MIKYKEFEVDGVKYASNQYLGEKSFVIFGELCKVVGKPLSYIMSSGVDPDSTVTPNLIATAIGELAQNMNSLENLKLVKEIISTTTIFAEDGNRSINFNNDFQGKMGHLFKLLKEILTFQYSDFLANLGEITPNITPSKKPHKVQALKSQM